jgi:hypothetical protein
VLSLAVSIQYLTIVWFVVTDKTDACMHCELDIPSPDCVLACRQLPWSVQMPSASPSQGLTWSLWWWVAAANLQLEAVADVAAIPPLARLLRQQKAQLARGACPYAFTACPMASS